MESTPPHLFNSVHQNCTSLWNPGAIKEASKANTALGRGRPREATNYAQNAIQALSEMTSHHEAVPFLKPPICEEKLNVAIAIMTQQSDRLAAMKKTPKGSLPRRNQKENALLAIQYLACAYRLHYKSLSVNTWPTESDDRMPKDGFVALLATFHENATRSRLLQTDRRAFLQLAKSHQQDIETFVTNHPSLDAD